MGALLFQPLTHCLWGGNGAANSVLLCCTRCREEGEPITETRRLPLSLTYLQQEQIVPTINIPICCAHQGLERSGEPTGPCCAEGLHRIASREETRTDAEHKLQFSHWIPTFRAEERARTACLYFRPLGLRRSKWRAYARCCSREETWRGSVASCGLCLPAITSIRTRASSKPKR